MSEHREEFILEIEKKLLVLTVRELEQVCKYWKISGRDSEDIKNKNRCALVKHVVKFGEHEELLEREDEGMSVLLEFASESAQSGLKYNRELVHSQCSQSIMTGLLNDNIRAEMRVHLQ